MSKRLPDCMIGPSNPCYGFEDLQAENEALRLTLERCRTILHNMTRENEGSIRYLRRWEISDEPLRNDAKNLLPVIDEVLAK